MNVSSSSSGNNAYLIFKFTGYSAKEHWLSINLNGRTYSPNSLAFWENGNSYIFEVPTNTDLSYSIEASMSATPSSGIVNISDNYTLDIALSGGEGGKY